LVALHADDASGHPAMGVARITADGVLDPTFGGGAGFALAQASPSAAVVQQSAANSLVVQADGRIVVGGPADDDSSHQAFALARFLPDGGLDTGFGSQGIVLRQFSSAAVPSSIPYALAVQANGKLLQVGNVSDASGHPELAVARFTVDGALDTSFASS